MQTASTREEARQNEVGSREKASAGTRKFYIIWVIAVTASAFGPYLQGSIRTEQLAVYLSLSLSLVLALTSRNTTRFSPHPWPVLGLLIIILVAAAISATQLRKSSFLGEGNLLAGLDNLALPIAVVIVAWQWRCVLSRFEILRAAAVVTVTAMTLNAVIAVAQWQGLLSEEFLRAFWVGGGDAALADNFASVAANAADNSRYSGLFNQPAEAGIAYAIALMLLIWLALNLGERRRVLRATTTALCSTLLIVGGVITISKVFMVAAPLSVLVFTVVALRGRQVAAVLSTSFVGIMLAGVYLSDSQWYGSDSVAQFYGDGLLSSDFLTGGGRYGTESSLAGTWEYLWQTHPILGVGLSGIDSSYDSLWIAAMVYAGLVGVLCTMALFTVLIFRWFRSAEFLPRSDRGLSAALLVIAIGASLGIPSITANRVSTLWWIPMSVLLVCGAAKVGSLPRNNKLQSRKGYSPSNSAW